MEKTLLEKTYDFLRTLAEMHPENKVFKIAADRAFNDVVDEFIEELERDGIINKEKEE